MKKECSHKTEVRSIEKESECDTVEFSEELSDGGERNEAAEAQLRRLKADH